MKTTTIFVMLLFLLICSCKKKNDTVPEEESTPVNPAPTVPRYDTIKPGSYFPVWPGSWWTYSDIWGNEVTESASKTWKLHSYRYGYMPDEVTDSVFVSFYQTDAIYRYNKLDFKPTGMQMFTPYAFLSEKIGPLGTSVHESGSINISETLKVVSKSVSFLGDSTITVWGSFYISPYTPPQVNDRQCKSIRIYQKNVGMIFHCKYDTITKDTLLKFTLLKHHIAPH